MAARGSVAKDNISRALLQIFPGSFVDADGKTIRIPTRSEGEVIEIKVALTAAKDVIGEQPTVVKSDAIQPQNTELTEEEIAEVRSLIMELNL